MFNDGFALQGQIRPIHESSCLLSLWTKVLVHMQAKNGQVYYNKLEFCFVVNYSGIQTAYVACLQKK